MALADTKKAEREPGAGNRHWDEDTRKRDVKSQTVRTNAEQGETGSKARNQSSELQKLLKSLFARHPPAFQPVILEVRKEGLTVPLAPRLLMDSWQYPNFAYHLC